MSTVRLVRNRAPLLCAGPFAAPTTSPGTQQTPRGTQPVKHTGYIPLVETEYTGGTGSISARRGAVKPLAGLSCCLSSVTKLSPFLPDSSVAFVQRLNRPTESRAVAQPGRFGHPKRREMLLCIWEAARITPPPPRQGPQRRRKADIGEGIWSLDTSWLPLCYSSALIKQKGSLRQI